MSDKYKIGDRVMIRADFGPPLVCEVQGVEHVVRYRVVDDNLPFTVDESDVFGFYVETEEPHE